MSMPAPADSTMTLGRLFEKDAPEALRDMPVQDLALDSRNVRPGSLFLAVAGTRGHGLDYLDGAVAAGAAIVVWEPEKGRARPRLAAGISGFPVPGLGDRLGELAGRFFGDPATRMGVLGVTGTNGKTTVTWLLAGALECAGEACGLIGTLGCGRPDDLRPSGLTTPDVVEVQRTLAGLRNAGARWAAMEVSSHALDQRRVAGVRFRAAAFTNLSREHLDYHGTLQRYGDAKAKLFQTPGLSTAVVNAGDAFGRALPARVPADVDLITVGPADIPALARGRRLSLRRVDARPDGLSLDIGGSWGPLQLESPLLGRFNADNLLLALGILLGCGLEPGKATRCLARVPAPPGRMESFGGEGRPLVVVDYAHTPDALAQALAAARVHCRGRLWCVMGCGGDRDPGKRPEMGRIAEELADIVVITDDNPRGENPAEIVAAIRSGLARPAQARIEHDRAEAIRLAVRQAARADVVLVAGKGHEDYQIVGSVRRPFSDQAVVLQGLEERP